MINIKSMIFRYVFSNKIIHSLCNKNENSIAILVGHHVHTADQARFRKPPNNSIPADDFRNSLIALKKNHTIISLDEAVMMMNGEIAPKKKCVVLTFDDSMKCNVTLVAPILSDLEVNGTFYLSTNVIERQEPYWWYRVSYALEYRKAKKCDLNISDNKIYHLSDDNFDDVLRSLKKKLKWLPYENVCEAVEMIEEQAGCSLRDIYTNDPFSKVLSWEDVQKMIAMKMTIGGHTIHHHNVTLYNEAELKKELVESKRFIEKKCGVQCRHFSYPYGIYNDTVASAVQNEGYASATTMESPGWNICLNSTYTLRRFGIPKIPFKVSYYLLK